MREPKIRSLNSRQFADRKKKNFVRWIHLGEQCQYDVEPYLKIRDTHHIRCEIYYMVAYHNLNFFKYDILWSDDFNLIHICSIIFVFPLKWHLSFFISLNQYSFVCIYLVSSLTSLVNLSSQVVLLSGVTHRVAQLVECLLTLQTEWDINTVQVSVLPTV